jgi:hypothetical protein
MAFGIANYVWDFTKDADPAHLMLQAKEGQDAEHISQSEDEFFGHMPSKGVRKSIEAFFVSLESITLLSVIGGSLMGERKYVRQPLHVLGVVEDYSVESYPGTRYKVTYTKAEEASPEQIMAVAEAIEEGKRSMLYSPPVQGYEVVVLGRRRTDDEL